ncbi:enoyl-CoA hydratase-related protein [Cumulibacter manganitolerans]|uniref:enoyl-CoA hydratase-related protein n=1 Tax=Cumulibacter manganitolerans TaxID=1884992 RepID=UPI001296F706|nr:enoyl-CoA hydratase-related protein [Cumulibacter manganitolerans]
MSLVETERRDHLLLITLNRPDKRNAVDRALADALDEALNLLDDDDDLWCGVLTGNGAVFCAGSDLQANGDYVTERGGEYGIIRRHRRTPLIAALQGAALGGGLEIALACDLIVASRTAVLGLPEVKRGLIPTCAGLFRGPRALPLNMATELALTGEPITAERAAAFGLVNRVSEPDRVLDDAIALAESICANGPLAVRLALGVITAYVGSDDDLGFALTDEAKATVYDSADRAEGVAAFFEKRAPQWSGR